MNGCCDGRNLFTYKASWQGIAGVEGVLPFVCDRSVALNGENVQDMLAGKTLESCGPSIRHCDEYGVASPATRRRSPDYSTYFVSVISGSNGNFVRFCYPQNPRITDDNGRIPRMHCRWPVGHILFFLRSILYSAAACACYSSRFFLSLQLSSRARRDIFQGSG